MPRFVEFIPLTSALRIVLLPAGRDFLNNQRDDMGWRHGTLCIFLDLIEFQLRNGWSMVKPEDIGALTSAPILSDNARYDDQRNFVDASMLYWFPDYAVTCEIEELLVNGEVRFPIAPLVDFSACA